MFFIWVRSLNFETWGNFNCCGIFGHVIFKFSVDFICYLNELAIFQMKFDAYEISKLWEPPA